ncbi:MAG TPA: hypothetical protein VFK74_04160 [Azospira sp.]|nr:hypothetical protein [Azospira sp.]
MRNSSVTRPALGGNGRNGDGSLNEYGADTPSSGFDDQLLWISRPLLLNRLIAAGRSL